MSIDLRHLANVAAGVVCLGERKQGRPATRPWSPRLEARRAYQREWARRKKQKQQEQAGQA